MICITYLEYGGLTVDTGFVCFPEGNLDCFISIQIARRCALKRKTAIVIAYLLFLATYYFYVVDPLVEVLFDLILFSLAGICWLVNYVIYLLAPSCNFGKNL